MQEITATISNASMETSQLQACFFTVLAALLLSGMAALRSCQLLFIPLEEARVAHHFPIGKHHKGFESQVSPNAVLRRWQVGNVFFQQDADKEMKTTVTGGPRPVARRKSSAQNSAPGPQLLLDAQGEMRYNQNNTIILFVERIGG